MRDSIDGVGACPSPRDTTKLIEVSGGPCSHTHIHLITAGDGRKRMELEGRLLGSKASDGLHVIFPDQGLQPPIACPVPLSLSKPAGSVRIHAYIKNTQLKPGLPFSSCLVDMC